MSSYTAAATLMRLVGDFAQRQPRWGECIVYQTKPDERWDVTLAARRVYGSREDFLAILAAAGLDSVEQVMTERELVLPSARQLLLMKQRAGFSTDPFARTAEQAADPIGTR